MAQTILPAFLVAFLAASAAVMGYWWFLEKRASKTGVTASGAEWEGAGQSVLLKGDELSTISVWGRLLARFDYVEIMKARIAEAGLRWSVGRLTALMLLSGVLALAVLMRQNWTSALGTLGAACVSGLIPYLGVLRLRRKRLARIESQFPDSLDSLARALRAGNPLMAGMQMLAYEAPQPLAGEIRKTVDERSLGLSWDQALDNLAQRVPLVEISIFVAAVKLQNRTGGKLNEILSRLSETMRESYALKGEVQSIAAHGKLTGRLLTILPVGILIAMTTVNPGYFQVLWQHPAGKDLTALAVASLVTAHLLIRKLVDIRL